MPGSHQPARETLRRRRRRRRGRRDTRFRLTRAAPRPVSSHCVPIAVPCRPRRPRTNLRGGLASKGKTAKRGGCKTSTRCRWPGRQTPPVGPAIWCGAPAIRIPRSKRRLDGLDDTAAYHGRPSRTFIMNRPRSAATQQRQSLSAFCLAGKARPFGPQCAQLRRWVK